MVGGMIDSPSIPENFLACLDALDGAIAATESWRPLFFLAASGLTREFH